MYKNKAPDGKLNISGKKISQLRMKLEPKCSQKKLADIPQLQGLEFSKNTIQCIESGKRFVTDIELKAIANVFGVTADELLSDE